ncbi:MAG: hypothetical protein HYU99_07250 [Deltaproteobacteria bacterium]|nr:hypothetical protein [Deltaproteobacteria bacterium]
MNLQKINWKIYFKNPEAACRVAAKPDIFFKVFNSWIPNSPEIFVDVADYKHVHDGPLILLAGYYADYALDLTSRRLGFLYSRKQPMEGSAKEKIKLSLLEILKAADRLENDPAFEGKLKFATNEFLFIINDRALAPNTPETFTGIKPVLQDVLSKALENKEFNLEHLSNPKQRFSVKMTAKREAGLKEMIDRLS